MLHKENSTYVCSSLKLETNKIFGRRVSSLIDYEALQKRSYNRYDMRENPARDRQK